MNSGLITVSNYLSKGDKKVPYIRLKGVWLNEYGFAVGTQLFVECSDGIITIKVKENPKTVMKDTDYKEFNE